MGGNEQIMQKIIFVFLVLIGLFTLWKIMSNEDKQKWKNIFKAKSDIKDKNIDTLMLIQIIFFGTYVVSLLIVLMIDAIIKLRIITFLLFTIVILLGAIILLGHLLIQNNTEGAEEENEHLISYGEKLVSTSLQILIGTIAIGVITLLINTILGII